MTPEQRRFVDGLVALVREQHPPTAIQAPDLRHRAFVDGLLALIRQRDDSRPVADPSHAAFRSLIMEPWDALVWRLAGALAWRTRQLTPEQFAQLQVLEDHPSLLGPLNRTRDELSHTTLIGWLLGDDGPVGRSARRAFASRLGLDVPEREWRVKTEKSVDEGCRVDVEIDVPGHWLCYVEAKIDAQERENQLIDYEQALLAAAETHGGQTTLIFLTPEGRNGDKRVPHEALSFRDLLVAWLPVAARHGREATYLSCWLVTLAQDICRISEEGSFTSWSFARQRRTLQLFEDIQEATWLTT